MKTQKGNIFSDKPINPHGIKPRLWPHCHSPSELLGRKRKMCVAWNIVRSEKYEKNIKDFHITNDFYLKISKGHIGNIFTGES